MPCEDNSQGISVSRILSPFVGSSSQVGEDARMKPEKKSSWRDWARLALGTETFCFSRFAKCVWVGRRRRVRCRECTAGFCWLLRYCFRSNLRRLFLGRECGLGSRVIAFQDGQDFPMCTVLAGCASQSSRNPSHFSRWSTRRRLGSSGSPNRLRYLESIPEARRLECVHASSRRRGTTRGPIPQMVERKGQEIEGGKTVDRRYRFLKRYPGVRNDFLSFGKNLEDQGLGTVAEIRNATCKAIRASCLHAEAMAAVVSEPLTLVHQATRSTAKQYV